MPANFSYFALRFLLLLGFVAFAPQAMAQQTIKIDPTTKPEPEPVEEIDRDLLNRYGFSIRAQNARALVTINGIPLLLKSMITESTEDITFNEWVKRGLNVVEIRIERLDSFRPYKFEYQVYYQSPSQVINGERLVLAQSKPDTALPLRQSIGMQVQTIPLMRVWDAEAITMNNEDRASLIGMINQQRHDLSEAFNKQDSLTLATYKNDIIDEVERAYGRPLLSNQDIANRRKAIAEKLATSVNSLLEVSPIAKTDDLDIDVIANGTLVRIVRKDRTPVLRIKRGDVEVVIDRPIYGIIGGAWKWLR